MGAGDQVSRAGGGEEERERGREREGGRVCVGGVCGCGCG